MGTRTRCNNLYEFLIFNEGTADSFSHSFIQEIMLFPISILAARCKTCGDYKHPSKSRASSCGQFAYVTQTETRCIIKQAAVKYFCFIATIKPPRRQGDLNNINQETTTNVQGLKSE